MTDKEFRKKFNFKCSRSGLKQSKRWYKATGSLKESFFAGHTDHSGISVEIIQKLAPTDKDIEELARLSFKKSEKKYKNF